MNFSSIAILTTHFQLVQIPAELLTLCSYPQLTSLLFLSAAVSAKEGAMQLASKALLKKSPDRSLHYTANTIIESAQDEEETVQQVSHTQI